MRFDGDPLRRPGSFFPIQDKEAERRVDEDITEEERMRGCLVSLSALFLLTGCASAGLHRGDLRDDAGERIGVGTVQKEIRIGMSAADVAASLGSPNIVTVDEERREVWIYDKIATEVYYSESEAGLRFLTPGRSGGRVTTQRTLTIIIKYDNDKKVRDFSYHTSRF